MTRHVGRAVAALFLASLISSEAKPVVAPVGLAGWLRPSNCAKACESQWWNVDEVRLASPSLAVICATTDLKCQKCS
jgi:hypothetical protein